MCKDKTFNCLKRIKNQGKISLGFNVTNLRTLTLIHKQ